MKIEEQIADYLYEEKGDEEVQKKIMKLLADNPSPGDDVIHAFAEKEGINTHKFEAYIYDILGSLLGTGRAKEEGFTIEDADPKELKMGIEVEKEHTTNPLIAARISIDHLAELPDYYTRLAKMEAEGEKAKEKKED